MTAAEQASLFAPEPSTTLDCRGMQCPAPILELSKAARALGKQPSVLEIIVDDADFPQDLKAWCRASKNQLIHIAEQDGIFVAHVGVNIGEDRTPSSGTRAAEGAGALPNQTALPLRPATPAPASPLRPAMPAPAAPRGASAVIPREAVDCRGMQCPAPILAVAKKAQLFHKQPAFLDIAATDPDFPTDLRAWCKAAKAQLVALEQIDGCYEALVALNGAERLNTQSGPSHAASPAAPVATNAARVTVLTPIAPSSRTSDSQTIDLRGLVAPEPIAQLSKMLSLNPAGITANVLANDPSFMTDVMTWALSTKVEILSVTRNGLTTVVKMQSTGAHPPAAVPTSGVPLGSYATARSEPNSEGGAKLAIAGAQALSPVSEGQPNVAARENLCSILIIKNDFESLMAAMMVATTSAAQGMEVNVFFSFWGVNLLRGDKPRRDVAKQKVSFLQKMMQWMMPRGPHRQKMSKMHMGGMGKGMMQHFMKKNNVLTLEQLMAVAVEQNVKFTVCSMSMGIMGIQKRDIVDFPNVEFAGVTSFVETSRRASMSLVF